MSKSNATGWVSQKDHYAVPVLFNPYTGEPRDVRDVQSDPQGILIVPPGKVSVLASTPSPQAAQQAPAGATPSDWDMRGCLAASLTCWHRLKPAEAEELVALAQRGWNPKAVPQVELEELRRAFAPQTVEQVWTASQSLAYPGKAAQIINAARALLAAPAAPSTPASGGWMPIETAPKDGLVDILNNGRRYAGCHYDRICDEYRHITACGVLIRLKQATHWMPVPASPTIEGESNV